MPEHNIWLDFAVFDLKAAQLLIESKEALIPPALVLALQSAEKSLKSYLYFKG